MRCGVLDIGSRSVHLKIADLAPGGPPETVTTLKRPVRLAEATDAEGVIHPDAVQSLIGAVTEAAAASAAHEVDELVPFATSAVRDATNRDAVLAEVEAATGVRMTFMSGVEEARLTFLAARAWHGWSAGRMLLLDIGGGSLEIAYGGHAEPAIALSLPLGAGRLTRRHLPDHTPVKKRTVKELRRHVCSVIEEATAELRQQPTPTSYVATSKTFTQLARLTGTPVPASGASGAATGRGPGTQALRRDDLRPWPLRLATLSDAQRAQLPGISAARAHQSLAGAVVAEAVMKVLGVKRLTICPWALREGVLLERLIALAPQAPSVIALPSPVAPRRPPPSRKQRFDLSDLG
ncbi:Ppx/GppA family phosphatase [Streptomyces hygroscopicus subsp. hygroscopicus]|uniref:Ppx/GppA phosphatase family protein n=1 Tax=Streptomyces hygroscopicus TaxID=1912 RepID=UPI001C656332|nr:Ppx/GppA phosphatase family protein [Streptomyces hygroscopicus]MBW8091351.1 Ppx/GppA family phosphatase [Streptomyces hygroscopicus subsp. hygroscopicus]